jgi:hypothetical protein
MKANWACATAGSIAAQSSQIKVRFRLIFIILKNVAACDAAFFGFTGA